MILLDDGASRERRVAADRQDGLPTRGPDQARPGSIRELGREPDARHVVRPGIHRHHHACVDHRDLLKPYERLKDQTARRR